MMSVTHAAIATATVSISLGTANGFVLGVAIVGSQLPDLDTSVSMAGRVVYPLASYLEARYPHRTITHSFLSTGVVAIATSPLLFLIHWHYWAALVMGQFVGWFADAFTKSGVAAFYPSPARLVIPGNPRARLRSRSAPEYWVLAIALFLTVASVNLVSAGGLTEQFAQAFLKDTQTAAILYQKYGAERLISVDVEGLHTATTQAIHSRFTVIEATSTDLLAESAENGRLYKIGNSTDAQIRPTRVQAKVGDRLVIQSQEVALQEIAVSDWLSRLPQNSYVSGSLMIEDAESLMLATEIESYPVVRQWGGQIELRNARPHDIEPLIGQEWIVAGRIIVKVRALS